MTRRFAAFRVAAVGVAALTLSAVTAVPAASAAPAAPVAATVTATMTFIGYGYLPSDAHADAVAKMTAYSSSCVETGTVYSSAGSEHYWKATLTAEC